MKGGIVIFALVALASAHVRFVPASHSSRSDNTFSVATGGCGAADAFNANNMLTVTAGDTITTDFNYGTGTNGDHADAANVFQGYWLCDSNTANLAAADILSNAAPLGDSLAVPGGSTPGGYDMSFTVPIDALGTCTYSVRDQRVWAGCLDYNVLAPPVPTTSTTDMTTLLTTSSTQLGWTWSTTDVDASDLNSASSAAASAVVVGTAVVAVVALF